MSGIELVAKGLARPEGVCVGTNGTVWVSDRTGLVRDVAGGAVVGAAGVEPNGLAVDHVGRIVVADYGDGAGLVRLDVSTGEVDLRVREADGYPVRRANHPALDAAGRIWCTCSTVADDDVAAVLDGLDDGFVFVVDEDGNASVAADQLRFPNGLAFSADGRWLFVAESGAQRVSRAPVTGGRLGPFEPYGEPLGAVPDGVAVDEEGGVWVSLVFQRRAVVVLSPDGRTRVAVEDDSGGTLGNPTNVAFAGDDRRDLLIACADVGRLFRLRVGVSGVALPPRPEPQAGSRT